MTEFHPTPAETEAAWEAAQAANDAFHRRQAAETQLASLHKVAGFALDGVTIEDRAPSPHLRRA